jgi:Predicted transcriptional regulator
MSENIKRHLNSKGLNVKDFSEIMDFKYTTVLDWVNAKTYPRIDKIELMARYFGVDKSDLVEEYSEVSSTLSEINKISSRLEEPRQRVVLDTASSQLKEQQQENIIQLREWRYNYYDNAVSAGTGEYLTDGKQETIDLPVDYDADFVVPVNGDSMEPEYHDCDYVFVETTYDLSDGDIGVFILDGDAYIKELRIDEEGAYLHSLNPDYRDKPILPESDFRIVGKVVGRYNENDKKET